MRAIVAVRLVLVVTLLAGLLPALAALGPRSGSVGAAPPAQTPGCAVGAELIANGSFESPGLAGALSVGRYVPTGWSTAFAGYGPEFAAQSRFPVVGEVYVTSVTTANGILSQSVDVSGLTGATLVVSFVTSRDLSPAPTLGGVPFAMTGTTGTLTLPSQPDATGPVVFALPPVSGTIVWVDAVSVVVSACPVVPISVAPVFGPAADQTLEATGPAGATGYVVPTATDADAVTIDNPTGAVAVTCDPGPGSTFAPGTTTTVACTATDTVPPGAAPLGVPTSVTFSVTVRDTGAPILTGLTPMTVPATSTYGAVVSYAVPVAVDVVDASVAVTCAPGPGSQFPIGTTTVSCAATDAGGNTTMGSFTVTVDPNGFRDPRDPRPGASPQTEPPPTPTPRPTRPARPSR